MRNPDRWLPREPEEPDVPELPREEESEPPGTRRGALVGLIVVVLLLAACLVLTHVLRGMSQLQDCALSGRSNCS